MVVNKPYCGFRYCRYNFDGNCKDEKRYEGCEFQYYKQYYDKAAEAEKNIKK